MRFECMDYEQQKKTLIRIFNKINKRLYRGLLPEVYINIENVNNGMSNLETDAWAVYRICELYNAMGYKYGAILFDNDIMEEISTYTYQKEQIHALFWIMAHEMVHLYCRCHDIDDSNHGDNFRKVAIEHGLSYVTGEDGKEHQVLSLSGQLVMNGFRL